MIYPTAPLPDENEPLPDSRKKATEQLENTVGARGKFYYYFTDYYWTWFILSCCCCCLNKNSLSYKKRVFRYERYEKAVERMNEEIDILKHIQNQRASGFLQKLILRKHQRALVSSFQKFLLDDMIKEEEAERKKAKSAQLLADRRLSELLNDESEYYRTNQDITEDPNMTDAQK